eukprot:CAMPEP_0185267418 /NCGR_PEP_ID=MMETSP1359-20130426/34344_1 /TAXON_ID=552665 /ORGANISM="Bigelowiella longifila, Strain CCMP242" /LENGTH=99 /DNA_ID=CAMNT_0027857775 /DNA_START=642 /DNA_END=941 /DNA_ORIENTATION=+
MIPFALPPASPRWSSTPSLATVQGISLSENGGGGMPVSIVKRPSTLSSLTSSSKSSPGDGGGWGKQLRPYSSSLLPSFPLSLNGLCFNPRAEVPADEKA